MPLWNSRETCIFKFLHKILKDTSLWKSLVSPGAYMFDIVVCASGDESLIKDLIWALTK